MTLDNKKKCNLVLIGLFAIGTTLCAAYAAVAFKGSKPELDKALSDDIEATTLKQCITSLSRAEPRLETVEMPEGIAGVIKQKINNPYQTLTKISAGIQDCAGYTIQEFCMGDDCKQPVVFRLGRAGHES